MRQSLINTFDEIYLLDLHGNSKKKEKCPDGSKDENVFDIRQGVAIALLVKYPEPREKRIFKADLQGLRDCKYEWLDANSVASHSFIELEPESPFYLFTRQEKGNEHYLNWPALPDIFPGASVGIVTARDNLTIQNTPNQVRKTIHHFASLDSETARIAYRLGKDTRDWKVLFAQKDLKDSGLNEDNIVPILYRPYDTRYTYYTGKSRGFHCMPRNDVMRHMLHSNLCIICNRQTKIKYSHALIANSIVDYHVLETANANSYCIPLLLIPSSHKEDIFASEERRYNITPELLDRFSALWPEFVPEQLFFYVYAILHSNIYRARYAQYLKMDFPRIPFPKDWESFLKLAEIGEQLANLHLLKSPLLADPGVKYQGSGVDDTVEAVSYDPGSLRVRINLQKFFEGVTPQMWEYHIGGYQVLAKYLKDRKGSRLDDPVRYCRIAAAIKLTMEFQAQIDAVYQSASFRDL
jgi:predicted helicase